MYIYIDTSFHILKDIWTFWKWGQYDVILYADNFHDKDTFVVRGMSKAELVDAMDKAGHDEAPTEGRRMLASGYDERFAMEVMTHGLPWKITIFNR